MQLTPVKGMRDFLPEDMAVRSWLFDKFRAAARRFNFAEYDACVVESEELFIRKEGDEITEQLYSFTDKGGRRITLRPEVTPTLARLIRSQEGSRRMPLRWFTVGQCFRYEKMQKGRKREHYQWNMDIVGDDSLYAELELLAAAVSFFQSVGLSQDDVVIRYNNRGLLAGFLSASGIPQETHGQVSVILDKLAKIGAEKVSALLSEIGVPEPAVEALLDFAGAETIDDVRAILEDLGEGRAVSGGTAAPPENAGGAAAETAEPENASAAPTFAPAAAAATPGDAADEPVAPGGVYAAGPTGDADPAVDGTGAASGAGIAQALREIEQVRELATQYGIEGYLEFSPALVRGLSYYTGTVFEGFERGASGRSIFGGGRYHHLIETYGGRPTPMVGFGFGDVVIHDVLKDRGFLPSGAEGVCALVIAFSESQARAAVRVAQGLQSADLAAELDLSYRRLKKTLARADKLGFSHVIIVAPTELEDGQVTMKDLRSGGEVLVATGDVALEVKGS